MTDTGQWYRCTADITAPLSHAVLQEDGRQWVVGKILEGAALEDKRVYQQMYQEMIQYNGKIMINSSCSVLAHCTAALLLFA